MSALAIDLWEKKVWIAIEINKMAFPKKIVSRIDLVKYLKEFFNLNLEIDTIVVWLPYDLYWKDLKQLNKTNKFIEKLRLIFPEYKIVWVDERFTTFEAQSIWNIFSNKQKNIDDISATLILETYLKLKKD